MKTRIVEFNSNGKTFYKVGARILGLWSGYLYRDGEIGNNGDTWKKLKNVKNLEIVCR